MKMNRFFLICLAAASIFCLNSCSDDSSGQDIIPQEPGTESKIADIGMACGENIQCKEALECIHDVCVEIVSVGNSCDQNHICTEDSVCTDGKCIQTAALGNSCDDFHICDNGLECLNGKCANPLSGEGMKCSGDDECKTPLKCHNDTCLNEVDVGEECNDGAYCIDSICDDDKICRHYGAEGENCDSNFKLCKEGLRCNDITEVCYIPGELGTDCSVNDCSEQYVCDSLKNVCMSHGELGDDCDDELFVNCDAEQNLQCIDGKCRKPVSGDDTCSDLQPCAENNYICYSGKCVESVGECESDSKCQADSYCCLEDNCEVKKVCLPYGVGPRASQNDACVYKTVPGLFEADIQCEWLKPASGEGYADSFNIVTPVFVARTPHDMGGANALIVGTYKRGSLKNGAGTHVDEAYGNTTVIRIFNPETCKVVENIRDENNLTSSGAAMAVGDVDGDGVVEIFAQRSIYQTKNKQYGGIIAFKWSDEEKKYVTYWTQYSSLKVKNYGWGGLVLHDLNDDGIPELINPAGEVLDAKTGIKLNGDQVFKTSDNKSSKSTLFAVVDDLDNDGKIETIDYYGNVYEWTVAKDGDGKITSQQWTLEYPTVSGKTSYVLKAVADFGTPGATPEEFDWDHKDGIAEIVSSQGIEQGKGKAKVAVHTLVKTEKDGKTTKGQQRVFYLSGLYGGGAPTLGDFDGDKLPEIGIAFGDYYTVFDPRCRKDSNGKLPDGCLAEYYLWKQENVDNSSFTTGSAVFDFDGDGQIEVVYADECYTRIYDGKSGDVLFSAKQSSRTAYEMPIIADVDNDQSAEIIMGANTQDRTCPTTDKIHRGIRCENNSDCTSKICEDGFCRCSENKDCNWRKGADKKIKDEYICTNPLEADKAVNSNKVCRANRPQNKTISGLRVMRERYDRWVSSRPLWNQFSYSIKNINDDQTIPKTSDWKPNFLTDGLNNYRANSLGTVGINAAPDITGKLNKDNLCQKSNEDITLHGVICNRGTKMVASKMPASFYEVNSDGTLGTKFCTAETSANVPVGGCLEVSCKLESDIIKEGMTIRMISNDDGDGGRTTVECNVDNNTDEVTIDKCIIAIN